MFALDSRLSFVARTAFMCRHFEEGTRGGFGILICPTTANQLRDLPVPFCRKGQETQKKALRQKTDFTNPFNVIGGFKMASQNISLFQKLGLAVWCAHLAPERGALRDRHERWVQDAMDVWTA